MINFGVAGPNRWQPRSSGNGRYFGVAMDDRFSTLWFRFLLYAIVVFIFIVISLLKYSYVDVKTLVGYLIISWVGVDQSVRPYILGLDMTPPSTTKPVYSKGDHDFIRFILFLFGGGLWVHYLVLF